MRKAWGAPMSDDPGDRLTFDLNRPAAVAAILALIGALQPAIKFAVFPKRLHVDAVASKQSVANTRMIRFIITSQ
jgi:hypothetical protein